MMNEHVTSLWRFPIKSMQGERLDCVSIQAGGLVGDRSFAVIDQETGQVGSAKDKRRFGKLLQCKASFVEEPQAGQPLPAVRIEFPDASHVMSDAADVDARLSAYLGREVHLADQAPEGMACSSYHPDIEGATPLAAPGSTTAQKLGAALWEELGQPPLVDAQSFLDVCPVSVLSQASLQHLRSVEPASDFDERRFRMNLVLSGEAEDGFVENTWIGHQLQIGNELRIRIVMPDPRCVVTASPQADLKQDVGILTGLVKHNRLDIMGLGEFPCLGVYATVEQAGPVRVGDRATLVG